MKYLMLSIACLFLVGCSGNDSKSEQDAAAHKEAEDLFNETKENYCKSLEALLTQIDELVECSRNFDSQGQDKEKLEQLITFSFPKKNGADLFPTYKNSNSLILSFLPDGTKNERPKNGFNEFKDLSEKTKKLASSYADFATNNGGFSKKMMQDVAAMAAHYSSNLKYIFILRETENTYPELLSGGKFRQGSFRGDLLLYETGNNEPLAAASVGYSPPKTVIKGKLDVGAQWKLDSEHTDTIKTGVREAIEQIGNLEGAIGSYSTYSPSKLE